MAKSNLTQVLMKAFYLNEEQAELYAVLLIKGILTLGEIGLSINKSQDDCIKLIKDLTNLKLVKPIPGLIIRYKALPPFEGFFALIDKFQSLFEEINEDISNTSEKLILNFKNNIQDHVEEIQLLFQQQRGEANILGEQKEHYKREISTYITEVNDNSENINNEFNKITTTYLNSFEERINIIKIDVERNFSDALIKLKELKTENKDKFEESLNNLLSPRNELVKKLIDLINSTLKSSFGNLKSEIEKFKNLLITITSKSGDILLDFSTDLQGRIIKFLHQQDDDFNTSISEMKDKLQNYENEILELFSSKNSDLESSLSKNLTTIQDETEKALKSLSEKKNEINNVFFQNVADELSKQITDIGEILDLNKGIFLDNNEIMNKSLKELFDSYLKDYWRISNDIKNDFQEYIDQFKNTIYELIKKLSDRTIDAVAKHSLLSEDYITNLESNLTKFVQQNFESFQSRISNLIGNISNEFQNRISSFKENVLNLKDDLFENLTTTQTKIQKSANETQDEIFKVIDSQLKTIDKEVNTIETQMKESIVDEFERLNTEISSAKNEASDFFSNSISQLEKEPLIAKEKITKITKGQLESLDREVLLLNESIKTTNSNSIIQFKNIINQLQNKFLESSNKYFSGLKDQLLALEKEIVNSMDQNSISFKEKTTNFQEDFENVLENGLNYLENVQNFEKRITKDAKRHLDVMKKATSIIIDNVSNILNKEISDYNLATEAFKSSYSKARNEELSSTEELFTNLLNSFQNIIQDSLKSIKTNFNELESKISEIIDAMFLEIKTTDDTLSENLKDIIKTHLKDASLTKTQKDQLKDQLDEINNIFNALTKKLNARITNTFKKHVSVNEKTSVNLETSLKNGIKNNFEIIQTGISNLDKNVSSKFQNSLMTFKNNINTLNETLFQNLTSTQATTQKTVNEARNEVIKVLDSQILTIEKEVGVIEAQLREQVENEYKKLNEEIGSVKNEASTFFTNFLNELENQSVQIKNKISKLTSSFVPSLEKDSLLLNESIKTTISIFTGQFENIIEQLQKRFIETSNKHHEELKGHLISFEKDFFDMINERSSLTINKFQAFQKQFNNILEKRSKYLENLKNLERKLNQDLKRQLDATKKTASIVTDNVSNLMNKQISDFNLASDAFKSYFSKIMNKEISTAEETLSKLMNEMIDSFQENLKVNKKNFDDIQLEIPKVCDNSRFEFNKMNESLGKDVTELVNNYLLDWQTQLNDIRNKLDLIAKHLESVEKSSRKFQSSIRENLVKQSEKFDLSCNDLREKIQFSTDNNIKSINIFLDALKNGIDKATNNVISKIKNSITDNKSSFSNYLDQVLEDLTKNFKGIQDSISAIFNNYSRKSKNELDIQKEKLTQSSNEYQALLTTNFLEKSKAELESWAQANISSIEEKISPISENITTIIDQNNENFDIFVQDVKKNFLKMSSSAIKDYESRIQSVMELIDDSLFTQFNDQRDIISKISENIATLIRNEAAKSIQVMENLDESFENYTANQLDNILKLFNTVDSKLMDTLTQFKIKKIEPMDKVVNKIKKDLLNVKNETQTTIEILNSALIELENNTFIDTDKTWPIISNKSISYHIMDMNSRVKKSIWIILPTFSEINFETLKKSDPKTLIHIFTNVNLKKDKQAIQDILSLKNVRIWNVTEEIPLYVALKDAEELLLAPHSEKDGEIVGIVTEQSEYISLFQKILGPYFYNISNEIKIVEKGTKATVTMV